jgi:hypothetical protein
LVVFSTSRKCPKLFDNLKGFAAVFLCVAVIPLINLRRTGMDTDLFRYGPVWDSLVNKGYHFAPLVFWWQNTGFFFIFAIGFVWFTMDLKQIKLYAPALLPFFLGNYFFTQASDGLNIHMFMPTWGVLIVFCLFLNRIVEKTKDEEAKGVVLAVAILLYASSSVSGVMCMRKLWKGYTTMWTQAEEHVAEWIVRNTNKSDVFLSLEEVFEPVSLLAGRTDAVCPFGEDALAPVVQLVFVPRRAGENPRGAEQSGRARHTIRTRKRKEGGI